MTNCPLFSLIVPVYKVEKYLPQCIDSLLAQDFRDYEIILVDDGSPDRCPQICDEYARKWRHIRVVHKPNGGLSDARNAGIAVASGRYVTFVDSDDFWNRTDVLSGVAEIIDKYKPDVIASDFIKFYTDGDKYLMSSVISSEEYNGKDKIEVLSYLYYCQADMKMSACQKFAKRELLTGVNFEKGLLSEDIDWSLRLYPVVRSICLYSKPFYCYRQMREGSITNTASQRSFDSLMYIIEKYSNQIPALDIPQDEKDIYLGYLAYQLSIAMLFIGRLSGTEKQRALERINKYKYLFSGKTNPKTRKVAALVKVFGLSNACSLLYHLQKLRRKLKR